MAATQSPSILMECVLLLEHYLNKAWLQVPPGPAILLPVQLVIVLPVS